MLSGKSLTNISKNLVRNVKRGEHMNDNEFESMYCRMCGSQRCAGIQDTEMRNGCTHYQRVILRNQKHKGILSGLSAIKDKTECSLCKNDKNFKINFISGMNCTSSYSTFDFGMINDIKFCPKCGRKL